MVLKGKGAKGQDVNITWIHLEQMGGLFAASCPATITADGR